jgi:PAS domain S-box-containing protein
VSTFNRDIPLAAVTHEIESHLRKTRLATFKLLADDPAIDVQIEVVEPLEHAGEDCRRLAIGGVSEAGKKVPPLIDADDQQSAAQMCRELDAFWGLTEDLLRDTAVDGQRSAAQQRYDQAFEQLISRNSNLTTELHKDIARDASWLSRVGAGATGLVTLIAVAAAVVVGRHRRLLAENAQQAESLAAIVEASVDAVVGMSVDGLITSWNPAAERLYGYSKEEAVGRSRNMIVPADRREEESGLMGRARQGQQVQRSESDRLRKDGRRVPVALTLSPIFKGDSVQAIAAIGQDISDLKAKDAALRTPAHRHYSHRG